MWSILKGEWHKLRRCQILLVGIVALTLCPVAQYGVQLLINPELQDQSFDFLKLFANVIWGNTQIFLPISLVMIGGWLIDRENTNDTMKNLLTVPVSYPKLLGGKLIVTIFLSILFGIYSVAVTVLTGTLAGLDGLSAAVLLRQGVQLVAAAFNTSLVCMPMILIFGQMRGAYLGGSLLTFFRVQRRRPQAAKRHPTVHPRSRRCCGPEISFGGVCHTLSRCAEGTCG